ncbi:MAG: hypothetical protein JXA37_06465 [Chloroflexia bacterium]|nr:hypothetical protein [Chloroflexia bacterium]
MTASNWCRLWTCFLTLMTLGFALGGSLTGMTSVPNIVSPPDPAQLAALLQADTVPPRSPRAEYTVCPAGPPTCDYRLIQQAVNAAAPGDIIKVAGGVYSDVHSYAGHSQVVYISRSLSLRGGYVPPFSEPPDPAAHPTILDANGRGRVLYISGEIQASVYGLHLQGGQAGRPGASPASPGGGVHIVSATTAISHCYLISNSADYGGGLYMHNGHLDMVDNVIQDNQAQHNGGGLYLVDSQAWLQDNQIRQQQARYGGGLYLSGGAITMSSNLLQSNQASYLGGGVYQYGGIIHLEGNQAISNSAGTGGGMYIAGQFARLESNRIQHNQAVYECGGLIIEIYGGNAELDANTITHNQAGLNGGGLCFGEAVRNGASGGQVQAQNNYIAFNRANRDGGGAFLTGDGGTPALQGNILQGNTAGRDGGGVYLHWSSEHTLLGDNVITENQAQDRGGGIYLGTNHATLSDNQILSNTAANGAGVYGWADLEHNQVRANQAAQHGGGLYGGGILNNNIFAHNNALRGGGMYLSGGEATLINNLVVDNRACQEGAGIFVQSSSPKLLHTTLAGNQPGNSSALCVSHRGGGPSQVSLSNTILVSHALGISLTAHCTVSLQATLWGNQQDWRGEGTVLSGTVNLRGRPAFVDPEAGDYHLAAGSRAIDAGLPLGVDEDLDGQPRPIGAGPDLGADEFPAALELHKSAWPQPAVAGQPLTYTLRLSNSGLLPLTSTIVDHLPLYVTPVGTLTWTAQLAPGACWSRTVGVRVDTGYDGLLTNVLRASTGLGLAMQISHTIRVTRPAFVLYYPLLPAGGQE